MTTADITTTTITATFTAPNTVSVSVASVPVSVVISNIASDVLSVAYGNIYIFIEHTEPPLTIDITEIQTWVEIGSGFSGGEEYLTTFQNDHEIKISVPGKYLINWSISMTSGAGNEVMGTVGKNNNADNSMSCHSTVASANKFVGVSGTGIIDCEIDDVISMFVLNESGTADIQIEHATLTIVYLGPL